MVLNETEFNSCGVTWVASYEVDDNQALLNGIYLASDQQTTNLIDVAMSKVESDAQDAVDRHLVDSRVGAAEYHFDMER